MATRSKLVPTIVAVASLLASAPARAQNVDPFFFGDEAAIAAGSVVASGRDSGSLWYNPAGFGALQRGLVSASGSTFGVRLRTVPRALQVISGGRRTGLDLASTDIISVPNAVVAATALGERFAVAGGLLVTQRDLRSALVEGNPTPATDEEGRPFTLGQRLDMQSDDAKYHVGGAFAAALSSRLRLGVSLFGVYAKSTSSVQYAIDGSYGTNPADERFFFVVNGRTTTSAFGGSAAFGLQWDLTSVVALGLTLRLPEVLVTASTEGGTVNGSATVGGTDPASAALSTEKSEPVGAFGEVLVPGRVHAGVSFALGPPQSFVEIGGDFFHGLPASPFRDALKPNFNLRGGVRYLLAPEWILGGGVFTDRTALRYVPEMLGGDAVNYYGATFGFSKRTPLALVKDPRPEALVLVTTLSLRGAVGFGHARALAFDFDTPNAPPGLEESVTYVDLMPYLGSSVVF